jgi:hypothetical protein
LVTDKGCRRRGSKDKARGDNECASRFLRASD